MIYVGADYYPEHWPEERWAEDARLMAEAGFNVARMAEFAWRRLEPEPGKFDFDWLDRAIAMLAERGIQTVLGTPTAAPPAWLVRSHPDILTVDENGVTRGFGTRHHRCVNSPALGEATERIVAAMAEHYAGNDGVIGYQLDNEFGCHADNLCYCEACAKAWREWLAERYGSPGELNRRWGLVFWGQEISSWDEMWTPRRPQTGATTHHSPSLLLEYQRFTSESFQRYAALQADILKRHSPGKFVTHNFMGASRPTDTWMLAEPLTLVAMDRYPGYGDCASPDFAGPALGLDLTRALAKAPYWVMEEQSGPTGWLSMSPTPRPGQIALWAWQAVARGADGIVFFRWRACRFGAEQYWHGILGHDGLPGRRYLEAAAFARRFRKLADRIEPTFNATEVAIIDDYDSDFAMDVQPGAEGISRRRVRDVIHAALARRGIMADFIHPEEPLEAYSVIFAPPMFVTREDDAERFAEFVREGGELVLTFRSGVKDDVNACLDVELPGPFREVAGLVVEEYDPIGAGTFEVETSDGKTYGGGGWADIVRLEGARAIAEYKSQFYAGAPAVTENRLGKGKCFYVGAMLDDAFWLDFVSGVCAGAGLEPVAVPDGVEIARRSSLDESLAFVLNHTPKECRAGVGVNGRSLLTGGQVVGTVELAPYGVEIIEEST